MKSSAGRVESPGLSFSSVCEPPSERQARIESGHDPNRDDATFRGSAFLSVRDVAAYLGVSYNSVLGAIKNGSLPAHRFGPRGGTYRIGVDDLIAYVEASRTGQRPSRRSGNRKTGSRFTKLNAARLLDAWKSQGVVQHSTEE